jgi:hypothetical protein
MKRFCTAVGVDHKVTAPYNARLNGKAERYNQSLMEALRCHCETNPQNWPKALRWVLWAYRTRINPITGYSTFMLTLGREMKLKKSLKRTTPTTKTKRSTKQKYNALEKYKIWLK